MAAQNSEKHPPLELGDIRDYYNAGIEQYSNEFRTLGERANAFLLTQSILVAALVLIFTNLKEAPIPFGLVAMGIILLGIFFCMLYIRAGRSGAYSAYAWRKYLLHLENENPDAPWNWFAKYFKGKTEKVKKEAKCCVTKYLMKHRPEAIDEGALAKYLPLPNSWLFSTSAFLAVWTGSTCIYRFIPNDELPLPLFIIFAIITGLLIIFALYLLCQAWKEWKNPYGI